MKHPHLLKYRGNYCRTVEFRDNHVLDLCPRGQATRFASRIAAIRAAIKSHMDLSQCEVLLEGK
jgi:hypothetical protein